MWSELGSGVLYFIRNLVSMTWLVQALLPCSLHPVSLCDHLYSVQHILWEEVNVVIEYYCPLPADVSTQSYCQSTTSAYFLYIALHYTFGMLIILCVYGLYPTPALSVYNSKLKGGEWDKAHTHSCWYKLMQTNQRLC